MDNYLGLAYLGATIGAGLCAIGGSYGIAKIGSTAMESDARQPDELEHLRMLLFIAAALVEGVVLFGMVICMIVVLTLNSHLQN